MKNHFKSMLVFGFLVSIFLLSSTATAQTQPTITDPANDVTKVRTTEGPSGNTVINYQTVTDHPNIDILSASYVYDGNNTASISLTVKGKIESDNSTYYKITLNSTTSLEMIYSMISIGPGSILDQTPDTKFSVSSSTNTTYDGFGTMHSYVSGSILTMVINGTNMVSGANEPFNYNLPHEFLENSTTNWHIITWQGTNTSIYNTYGDTYWDFYPNSDNKYTSGYGQIQSSPGFELISIVAIPILILLKKKGKI